MLIFVCRYITKRLIFLCLFPREIVSFVFPRISMFPSTSARETLRLIDKITLNHFGKNFLVNQEITLYRYYS
jgi:hypothetical protein